MPDEFIHARVAQNVWLSACRKCRQLVAFGETLESLRADEQAHECDEAEQQVAEADIA